MAFVLPDVVEHQRGLPKSPRLSMRSSNEVSTRAFGAMASAAVGSAVWRNFAGIDGLRELVRDDDDLGLFGQGLRRLPRRSQADVHAQAIDFAFQPDGDIADQERLGRCLAVLTARLVSKRPRMSEAAHENDVTWFVP